MIPSHFGVSKLVSLRLNNILFSMFYSLSFLGTIFYDNYLILHVKRTSAARVEK